MTGVSSSVLAEVGKTALVTTLLVHGAGSTGTAATELLGLRSDIVLIQDRTGDVEQVILQIEAAWARHPDCTALVGVSLGAHAVARWAASTSRPLPRIACVLPAWTGSPASAADATARAARDVAREGSETILERLHRESPHSDVVRLLQLAWPTYTDEQLALCLTRASHGRGPHPEELAAITAPVAVIGWRGDAFHPESIAHQWARHLRCPTVALAARPDVHLLQRALSTAPGWG